MSLTLPFSYAQASPQPPLVPSHNIHLIPRNTLFLRQLSNLQSFNGSLGGIPASPITSSGDPKRPFEVEGDTFTDFKSAAARSCDRQFDGCSKIANENKAFKVSECDTQKKACQSTQLAAKVQDFTTGVASQNIGPDPDFPDFDLICDV
ncbi:hypothetical protein GQ43DRAFT_474456 [Delitschia confertaspora ATCC 74209]|uniref:Uncharacterized protein n=1 Tax=Delitschia confertaspora ATCC 74209 TaxID=1513339 RepID=A0A9P4JFK2_9PLEO|nr:hypothetical protein GQ43DRAFT_474456 [Delitschia confertaspora ATCC 74209]